MTTRALNNEQGQRKHLEKATAEKNGTSNALRREQGSLSVEASRWDRELEKGSPAAEKATGPGTGSRKEVGRPEMGQKSSQSVG